MNTHNELYERLKNPVVSIRRGAAQCPDLTPELLAIALKDRDYEVRYYAVKHNNMTEDLLAKALKDAYAKIRCEVPTHPKVTPKLLAQALQDVDVRVRERAEEQCCLRRYQIIIEVRETPETKLLKEIQNQKKNMGNIVQKHSGVSNGMV